MKILFIGEYRNATPRGEYAIECMRALVSVGADIVARPFIVNDNLVEPPEDILKLENNKTSGITHIIQDVNEENYDEHGGYTNIRLPLIILPYDLDNVYDDNSKLNLPIQIQGDYIFYWIGSLDRKDNLITVLRAFHNTFPTNKQAQLILNVTKHGEPQQIIDETVNFCNSVKQGIGLYPRIEDYKTEMIIPGFLSNEQKNALHNTGNCFMNIGLWGDDYDREWLKAIHKNKQVMRNIINWDLEPSFNADGYKGFSKVYSYDEICGGMLQCYRGVKYEKAYDLRLHSYKSVGKRILGYLK